MVALGKERGVSFKGIRSKPCTEELLQRVDAVWCMESAHAEILQERYPLLSDKVELFSPDGSDIDDPYFGSKQDVRLSFDAIAAIAELRINVLKEELTAAGRL